MIRLQTYAGFSFLAAMAIVYHAFSTREQFYPAMVYLSTSKICLVLLLNMGLVLMCIAWQLVKRIFLGTLREAEVERLNDQSWREVMEILFAITIFRQDFSVGFLAMVTALLLIKALHWLAQKRVEYIETTPTVTRMSHFRIVSFMLFLLVLDSVFLYNSVKSLIQTWQASVNLFFSFEYMILATTTVSSFIKYAFYVRDMLMDGQWERKAVYTFYLELIRDLLHLSMYLFFFLAIFVNYGVPLHLIRELYETFRNFKVRIADYIRYRKITSNMNERFPDATPEELSASDSTCIICREEMTTAKKLRCGHLFHVHCLRSWLERQHTCPTCRALVVPADNATRSFGHQHAAAQHPQPGSQAAGTSSQGPAAGTTSSPRQLRLQAAAAAASVYQKSFVCPPPDAFIWSSGHAFPLHNRHSGEDLSSGMSGSVESLLQHPLSAVPSSTLGDPQEVLIQQQIQALQDQLYSIRAQRSVNSASSSVGNPSEATENKGKSVIDATLDTLTPEYKLQEDDKES